MEGSSGLWSITSKKRLLARVAREIGPDGVRKAEGDPHSWRRPRPCGLTIHPGFGCPNACLYCYVGDVLGTGPIEPTPLRLSGLETAYALLLNPYFVPGKMGTFLAFGALCDPFHPALVEKTLDIMASVASLLGNPIQFSTKMAIGPGVISRLPREAPVCPLITITTLERASDLEPRAHSPWDRLKAMEELRRNGFKPMLFLRPMIPGLIEHEVDDIVHEAKRHGAVGVVVGALRVNKLVLDRLKRVGLHRAVVERLKRYRRSFSSSRRLVPVPSRDLRALAIEVAREAGLVGFRAACCANAFVADVPCTGLCWLRGFCSKCPNDCANKVPDVREDELREALGEAFGLHVQAILLRRSELFIEIEEPPKGLPLQAVRMAIEVATRRSVVLKT